MTLCEVVGYGDHVLSTQRKRRGAVIGARKSSLGRWQIEEVMLLIQSLFILSIAD